MEFKPSEKLKLIYCLYSLWFVIPMIAIVLGIVIGVGFPQAIASTAVLSSILIAVVALLAIWIPRFYRSTVFRLEQDHAYARYGVWWVKEKRVPYNLVSEVRVRQGPLQRRLGLCNVDVFTPATGVQRPELTYFQLDISEGMKIAEELRRRVGILTTRERKVIEEEILEELRRIRSLLEELAKK